MPVFEYIALDRDGKRRKGITEADNPRVARQRLKSEQLFVTELKESSARITASTSKVDVEQFFERKDLSVKELSIATRQLATLITAGLPLVSAISALADQSSPLLRRMLVQIREDVEGGETLARAIGRYPKSFPALYINMVAAGEASGTLDSVLTNLASYLEGQVELRRKIFSSLTYPILMLFLCSAVIVGLLIFVIPRIVEIFVKQGAVLPVPTRIVIAISDFLIGYWPVIAVLIVGSIATFRWYYKTEKGRGVVDNLLLKVPISGGITLKIATARMTQTLSTLLKSGVGLLTALDISRNIVANVHLRKAIEDARVGVQEGRSLARELGKSGRFPALLSHMIAVGEKSGELESMLERSGKAYENEVNASLAGLTSLLEPVMMILVGGVVLGIVVSVLLPMADLISIIQQ